MATLKEQNTRLSEIERITNTTTPSKNELMALYREAIQIADSLGYLSASRSFKDRLNWLMKSHEQQRKEISPYWQPE